MGPSLALSRVVGLVGGLALVAAFWMPWFSSQGLLLSGEFLDTFLGSASQAQLRQFLPASTPSEVQALRVLVDLFPACGALAAVCALLGVWVPSARGVLNALLGLAGLLPLVAWAIGISQLPSGANWEIGLWILAVGSLAIVVSLALELGAAVATKAQPVPSQT